MSEIEKMYENAGLSNMWVERYNDGYYEHENYYDSYKEMINNMMKVNDWTLTEAQEVAKRECSKELPPFTAEKQIEIIAFLVNKGYNVTFANLSNKFSLEQISKSLALCINSKWDNLTEEEKQQVKGILE